MSEAPDSSSKNKMSDSAEGNAPLISMRQLMLLNIGIQCSKDKGGVSYILSFHLVVSPKTISATRLLVLG